jgi:hypothetical protein
MMTPSSWITRADSAVEVLVLTAHSSATRLREVWQDERLVACERPSSL